ncbi:hypothetical protein CLU79DRAFT_737363, partial [Phycomyces nitens]
MLLLIPKPDTVVSIPGSYSHVANKTPTLCDIVFSNPHIEYLLYKAAARLIPYGPRKSEIQRPI